MVAQAQPVASGLPADVAVDWLQRPDAAITRAEAGGVAAGGRLYVFGGQYSGIKQTARSDRFDPATDTWTRLADLPELITHAPIVADGQTLWILGGYVGFEKKDSSPRVWKYDIPTNTYSAGPPLPAPRGAGGAAIVGRQLHYLGGAVRQDSTGAPVTDAAEHWVLELDGGTTWIPSAPLPAPRNHVGTAVLGGEIYLVGGQFGEFERTTPQVRVDAFDTSTGTWSRKADLPVARGHIGASTFVSDGRIITLGGSVAGGQASRTLFQYTPGTNTWTTRTDLPEGLRSPVADVVGDEVIVSGGRNSVGPTLTTWSGRWSSPPNGARARGRPTRPASPATRWWSGSSSPHGR